MRHWVATPSAPMSVHVLLFDAGSENEGIHSLELNGTTVVLLFEDRDDAERYAGLLEAQDFPAPTVEALDRAEMEELPMPAMRPALSPPGSCRRRPRSVC